MVAPNETLVINAKDSVDLTSSPGINPDTVVPIPTIETLRTLVSESQDLTLASVPEVTPLTISLN